jgi:hypothetical protein
MVEDHLQHHEGSEKGENPANYWANMTLQHLPRFVGVAIWQ